MPSIFSLAGIPADAPTASLNPSGQQEGDRRPGIYVLLFTLRQDTHITVGKLGKLSFPAGGYAYAGSGMRGAEARVRRHLRPHHRPSWHLDYLLPSGEPVGAILGHTTERLECALAQNLGRLFQVLPRFGSSDCRCHGHLFQDDNLPSIATTALDVIRRLGCAPKLLTVPPHSGILH